jgi:mannose-6-phosphate isomerase-like protein (cupin superfamily)
MPNINRRTLLYAFGIASVSPVLSAQTVATRRVVVAQPGENLFAYSTATQGKFAACKVTSDDSAGGCSIFELVAPALSGPPLHVHHREDEWYHVLTSKFIFEVGGQQYHLPVGGSIFAPRDIPHRWANEGKTEGKVILVCQPGGFEKFFDELGKMPAGDTNPAKMRPLLAEYGMELLGPPIFPGTPPGQHTH